MTTGRPELTKVTLNSIDVSSFILIMVSKY